MPFVIAKCPSCGGEIQLDDERQKGFCLYCGSQIDVKQAINSINVNVSGSEEDIKKWQAAFDTYCLVFDYDKAEKMADRILQARPTDPDSLNRYNVVRDAKNLEISSSGVIDGFKDKSRTISEVNIPLGVRSIGNKAFANCTALTAVSIPDSVTSIGNNAFYGCSSLKKASIPKGVSHIGEEAFAKCIALTAVSIPDSVTSIGNSAFVNCSSLAEVRIPGSVTSLGRFVFAWCSILKSVVIPDSVTSIGYRAFYECSSLAEVRIPDSITSYGEGVFDSCSRLSKNSIIWYRGLNKKEEEERTRFNRYWEEHSEEKEQLLKKKQDAEAELKSLSIFARNQKKELAAVIYEIDSELTRAR